MTRCSPALVPTPGSPGGTHSACPPLGRPSGKHETLFSSFQKPEPCEEGVLEVPRRWAGGSGSGLTFAGSWLRGMLRACTSHWARRCGGRSLKKPLFQAGKAPPPSCPGLRGDGESWGVPDPSSILRARGRNTVPGSGSDGLALGGQDGEKGAGDSRGGGGVAEELKVHSRLMTQRCRGGEGSWPSCPPGKVPGIAPLRGR